MRAQSGSERYQLVLGFVVFCLIIASSVFQPIRKTFCDLNTRGLETPTTNKNLGVSHSTLHLKSEESTVAAESTQNLGKEMFLERDKWGSAEYKCSVDASGNAMCHYPHGICTDGENVIVLDPSYTDGEISDALQESSPMRDNYLYQYSPNPTKVGIGVWARRGFPNPSRPVIMVENLLFLRGFRIMNLYHEMEMLINPINVIMYLIRVNEIPPEYSNPVMVLTGDAYHAALDLENPSRTRDHFARALFEYSNWNKPIFGQNTLESALGVKKEGKWLCGERGLLPSETDLPMTGLMHKYHFKRAVCRYFKLECPDEVRAVQDMRKRKQSIGSKILLVDRKGNNELYDRRFDNTDEMFKMLSQFQESSTAEVKLFVPESNVPVIDQVREFTESSVVVIGHGAAVTLSMFLPNGAVVIEIFPFQMDFPVYFRMAATCALYHFSVRSKLRGMYTDWRYDKGYTQSLQDTVDLAYDCSTRPLSDLGPCVFELKHGSIRTPIKELEAKVLDALSITFSSIQPTKVPAWELDNWTPGFGNLYPEYARPHLEPRMNRMGLTWEVMLQAKPSQLKS
eukprot:c10037_g1_i2.p1 GENE.c10037_g1_i2~~c10037_g1_i2.p1  ORF type:complete len:568 (+),score=114.31 c10037_g1_i2:49-1752(+)